LPGAKLGFGLGLMQVAVFLGMSLGPWIGGMIADTVAVIQTVKNSQRGNFPDPRNPARDRCSGD
jgi:hypothetical protein